MPSKQKTALPIQVLEATTKKLPSMRYAQGVAGLFSVVAIAALLRLSLSTALIGSVLILPIMFALLLFSRIASQKNSKALLMPALALTWGYVTIILVGTILLISSFLFEWPVDDLSSLNLGTSHSLEVSGFVKDANGSPIPSVSVTADSYPFQVLTSVSGKYLGVISEFDKANCLHLRFYREGYKSWTVDANVDSSKFFASVVLEKQ